MGSTREMPTRRKRSKVHAGDYTGGMFYVNVRLAIDIDINLHPLLLAKILKKTHLCNN